MARRSSRACEVAVATLILVGVSLVTAVGQLPTGTILGAVKDSTGAVVPNCTVTVRNVDTGFTRTQKSEADGAYRFAALPVGTYEVRAEQMGFETEVRSSVSLAVGQEAVVNFSLQVGAVTQTVEVVGEAPLVNTTSGSLGTLVNSQQVTDLPLNGRNYIDLTLLQPGVTRQQITAPSLASAGQWMSINGAPLRSNYYVMDGAPMAQAGDATTASVSSSTLGIDGIREWRVITNSFGAEYGMRMGGQMTIVSKGGTNSFHGSAFEYMRNSALDARNFFDYETLASERRLPEFQRNQFGGSLGGPIKKDKMFFFGTYEQLRQRLGVTTVSTTLAPGCHGAGGTTITNAACPQLGSTPSVTVSPVIVPLLNLYALPNLPNNGFTYPYTAPTDEHYGMARWDYNISAKDSAFIRYTIDSTALGQPLEFPQFARQGTSTGQYVTASDSHTFSASMVGTFRYSFSKVTFHADTFESGNASGLYFVPGHVLGGLIVGGLTNIGGGTQTPNGQQNNVDAYSADLYYTKGLHNFKFGTLVNHYSPQLLIGGALVNGSLTFSNVASFLQAEANQFQARAPGAHLYREYYFTSWGFYFQDDFRVRPNLTLNLGLRYEIASTYREGNGFNSSLRDVIHDAQYTIGSLFLNPSKRNIGPRFGFAWDVTGDGKTAVRGGFGKLYDVAEWGGSLSFIIGSQQPWSSSSIAAATNLQVPFIPITQIPFVFPPGTFGGQAQTFDYHMRNPHMLSYNLALERQLPGSMALTVAYAGSRGLDLMGQPQADARLPTILPDGRYFWTGTEPLVNPNWTQINYVTSAFNSWYNSLQVTVKKQLSKGLQFQSSYAWGKLIDERPGVTGGDTGGSAKLATVFLPKSLDRGPADYNIAQSWRTTAIYRFPDVTALTGIAKGLLSGWWTSGILSLASGVPYTVTTGGTDRSRSAGAGNQPDLNLGRNHSNIISGTTAGCPGVATGQKLGTPNLYYDPCAFSLEPNGFLGTEGRNSMTAPGLFNLDFSLVKDTPLRRLGEGGSIQFRVETFNILNRVNFSRPNLQVFSAPNATVLSNAGLITTTDNTSRQIQLALKILW